MTRSEVGHKRFKKMAELQLMKREVRGFVGKKEEKRAVKEGRRERRKKAVKEGREDTW
jgi:hypothetical protein